MPEERARINMCVLSMSLPPVPPGASSARSEVRKLKAFKGVCASALTEGRSLLKAGRLKIIGARFLTTAAAGGTVAP